MATPVRSTKCGHRKDVCDEGNDLCPFGGATTNVGSHHASRQEAKVIKRSWGIDEKHAAWRAIHAAGACGKCAAGAKMEGRADRYFPALREMGGPMLRKLLLGVSLILVGCRGVEHARQTRTVSVLLDLDKTVRRLVAENRRLPEPHEFWSAISVNHMRRDSWNHAIRYSIIVKGNKQSYIIASPGKNGKFEVTSLAEYLDREYRDVTNQFDADLLLVDGRIIQGSRK